MWQRPPMSPCQSEPDCCLPVRLTVLRVKHYCPVAN